MPKASSKTQTTNDALEVQAANARLLAPTAAELITGIENGDEAQVEARIKALGRQDFIAVMRVVQQLDTLLSAYALSWKNAEYWGRGTDYPV